MCPAYDYECPECEKQIEILHSIRECDDKFLCTCGGTMHRIPGSPEFQVNGMNAAGGYSDCIGDIQKHMGRPIENHDMDKHVSTLGKIEDD